MTSSVTRRECVKKLKHLYLIHPNGLLIKNIFCFTTSIMNKILSLNYFYTVQLQLIHSTANILHILILNKRYINLRKYFE